MIKRLLTHIVILGSLLTISSAWASGTFTSFVHIDDQQQQHPYIVYQPEHINTQEARPLLVYLHGAIFSKNAHSNPLESVQKSSILRLADQGQYYVLFPFGQSNVSWFNQAGIEMIMKQINHVQNKWKVHPQKIFLSGFSDGASGTFYIASTFPERFAGFLAFNGSFPVATHLGEYPIYPENINNKPFYIVNTQEDSLYPSSMMQPIIDELKKYTHNITFTTPKGNHHLGFLEEKLPEIITFIEQHQQTTPNFISWEAGINHPKTNEWLSIIEMDTSSPAADWHQTYHLSLENNKASLGLGFQNNSAVPFVVSSIKSGSTAEKLGVQIGDQILQMESTPMNHPYAPYLYLASKKAGETTSLTLIRDGKEHTLTGKFNPAYKYEVFEKQEPSAKIMASLDGYTLKINTSRVKKFSIDLNKLPPTTTINMIVLNGKTIIPSSSQAIQSFTVF